MFLTRWNRGRATSQRESARHSFCMREHLRQQGAKSENGPSFVCLYIPWVKHSKQSKAIEKPSVGDDLIKSVHLNVIS
jgi:hypothetical protein